MLQKAYLAREEVFNLLYKTIYQLGYYPKIWKKAIGVVLPKANKEDYSKLKSYRIISLLNCLGKTLEKILATRLSYLAES